MFYFLCLSDMRKFQVEILYRSNSDLIMSFPAILSPVSTPRVRNAISRDSNVSSVNTSASASSYSDKFTRVHVEALLKIQPDRYIIIEHTENIRLIAGLLLGFPQSSMETVHLGKSKVLLRVGNASQRIPTCRTVRDGSINTTVKFRKTEWRVQMQKGHLQQKGV